MNLKYEVLALADLEILKPLCNALMAFQKSKAHITPERFDTMNYETRLLPSVKGARDNHIIVAKDGDRVIAYAYSNINKKTHYAAGPFGCFFDMDSVASDYVGCLSQFYIEPEYRGNGIGSFLFNVAMDWMKTFDDVEDLFIYVSNGNLDALKFYESKGFRVSHEILDGFIIVMRHKKSEISF